MMQLLLKTFWSVFFLFWLGVGVQAQPTAPDTSKTSTAIGPTVEEETKILAAGEEDQNNLSNAINEAYDQLLKSLQGANSKPKDSFPVLFSNDTLFFVTAPFGPLTAKERAKKVNQTCKQLEALTTLNTDSFYVDTLANTLEISYKRIPFFTVTKADALHRKMTLAKATHFYLDKIKSGIVAQREKFNLVDLLIKLGLLLLVVALFVVLFKLINKGFRWLVKKVETDWKEKYIKGLKYNNIEFITDQTAVSSTLLVVKLIRILLLIFVFYISLPAVFYIFPATKSIANTLFDYILAPIKSIFFGFVNYVPSAIAIIVIILVTRYVIRFLKYLSLQIEREEIVLPGFYSDWAKPTFNIVRFVIYAFMFVVIFPYLPGSSSPVFQGVSVFLGLLISLGSTSAIGNMVAGLVITYMRPFRLGDRVKIGEIQGDVVEKSMLVTRVRTLKNEEVTIPNAKILSGHTVNFSASVKDIGIAVFTNVTIGYDVHWKKVHELLLSAAEKTEGIESEPKPFVLQTSLDDFYVSYQLNGYTKDPNRAMAIRSEMIQHIQDNFNEANIEILSPHYRANREGGDSTVSKPSN